LSSQTKEQKYLLQTYCLQMARNWSKWKFWFCLLCGEETRWCRFVETTIRNKTFLWKCKLWTSVIAFETKTSQVVTSLYTRNKNFSSISQDVANGLYSHEIFTKIKMNVKRYC